MNSNMIPDIVLSKSIPKNNATKHKNHSHRDEFPSNSSLNSKNDKSKDSALLLSSGNKKNSAKAKTNHEKYDFDLTVILLYPK